MLEQMSAIVLGILIVVIFASLPLYCLYRYIQEKPEEEQIEILESISKEAFNDTTLL